MCVIPGLADEPEFVDWRRPAGLASVCVDNTIRRVANHTYCVLVCRLWTQKCPEKTRLSLGLRARTGLKSFRDSELSRTRRTPEQVPRFSKRLSGEEFASFCLASWLQ